MASTISTNPAHAHFESFLQAQLCQDVLSSFQGLCGALGVEPGGGLSQYHKVKAQLNYWNAKSLWAKLDKRASQPVYQQGRACTGTKVCLSAWGGAWRVGGVRGAPSPPAPRHACAALCVRSAWWWVRDLAVCGLLWSWRCWGPEWCWWKSAPSSLATTCSTSGPSPSTTFGHSAPRSSMGASAQAPWTTSVSTVWWPGGADEPGPRDRPVGWGLGAAGPAQGRVVKIHCSQMAFRTQVPHL